MDRREFDKSIARFIAHQHLMEKGRLYLVALSGGPDSVALLRVLADLDYQIEAVHCNFRLRGDESDRDEAFCRHLCQSFHVPFHVTHFDTRTYAALHRVSIEMAARELRYPYFEKLRQAIGAAGICVAHHQDDSVETVLMNLLRGTGLKGLEGILPQQGYLIRPLLGVSRSDIEQYLSSIGQDFVIDSTNLIDDVTRNRMRLDIIPALEKINPAVKENVARTARYAGMAVHALEHYINNYISLKSGIELYLPQEMGDETIKDASAVITVQSIRAFPSPELLLYTMIYLYGFSGFQAEEIYESLDKSGKVWRSKTHELLLDRGKIVIQPLPGQPLKDLRIPEPGTYVLADRRLRIAYARPVISKDSDAATLDAGKVEFPLTLRLCHPGDRFVPFGMQGSRLVSDFLTDLKCNLFEKQRQLVLADAAGKILWVVGKRTDNRFRIDSHTVKALVVTSIDPSREGDF
ncbi:MAG: tRNA lysidine(34) synthetase TilS [Prevotella sp.]|nr:tRNA lysidine(34) synthetase TilS [Prevotella sp.]MCH4251026.1 tRNA lysidine(34) synthetase TilS [Prevotella sp.]